jgi:hypothetical protein
MPTNKKFGFFFTCVFALLAVYFHFKLNTFLSIIFLLSSALFLVLSIIAPSSLNSLNKAWYLLGLLLGRIVSPIILGIIFFLLITPTAIVMRLAGRDELRIKKRLSKSYWITRVPPGPDPESFKNQF